jgi:regulator of protease activity HflC (stomatin/prohibitin superfamily)
VRVATVFIMVLVAAGIALLALFNVPEGSEALVLRGNEVHRKVGPGYWLKLPVIDQVRIEAVARDRLYDFTAPVAVGGCPAAVQVVWHIGDLEAYHADRKDLLPLEALRPGIEAALNRAPFGMDDPVDQQIALRLDPLAGPVGGGLVVKRILVVPEAGCVPGG